MLKTSQILSHWPKWLSSMIAVALSVSLTFGSFPAVAWAQEPEAEPETSREMLAESSVASKPVAASDGASDEQLLADETSSAEDVTAVSGSSAIGDAVASEDAAIVRQLDDEEEASLFYIDTKKVEVEDEQIILFSFDRVVDAEWYVLSYSKIGGPSGLTCEAADVKPIDGETTVLFKLSFFDDSAIGDYRIDSVSWYGADEGTYEAPISDGGISFSVVKASECEEGITVTTLDDDGNVVETSDVADALEVVDEDAAAVGDATRLFSAAQSRAVGNANGNLVIGLDPGHGGSDGGAGFGGVAEKDLNLRIALACRDRLQQAGATVVMTRSDDRAVTLTERASIAKNAGATVFVSFHINSASGAATGYEVWVQTDNYRWDLGQESKALADAVRAKLAQFGLSDRGNKWSDYDDKPLYYPDGSRADGLCVLRDSKNLGMPAILIEHGFINNSYDRNIMNSRAEDMGRADAEALIEFYDIGGKLVWDASGIRYQFHNGTFLTNSFLTVSGATYYFNANGYAVGGHQYIWTAVGYNHYYFEPSSGHMVTNARVDGFFYGPDGKRVVSSWAYDGGKTYFVLGDGAPAKGPLYIWTSLGYAHYFFDRSDGHMVTNQTAEGCYYGADGRRVVSDWVRVNGGTYFALADGAFAKGPLYIWTSLGYAHYFFDRSDGHMVTNQTAEGCYYGADGKRVEPGWATISGKSYYLYGDGTPAKGPLYIWTSLGYAHYFFDRSDGHMVTNQTAEGCYYGPDGRRIDPGWVVVSGNTFYILGDGTLAKGKVYIWNNGYSHYYFNDFNGVMVVNSWVNGNYFGWDGRMAVSTWLGTIYIDADGRVDVARSTPIMGATSVTAQQLANTYKRYIESNWGAYPYSGSIEAPTIERFCEILITQANLEGVRAEVVFAQVMHETSYLRFTGDVKADQFNFAGLGATGGGNPGNRFNSIAEGLLAQVQHLKAYASTDSLNRPCVDPRFNYVPRGCAPIVAWLGQKENPTGKGWASAPGYGDKIISIMKQIY